MTELIPPNIGICAVRLLCRSNTLFDGISLSHNRRTKAMIISEMNQRIKNRCKLCSERNHYGSGLWNLMVNSRSKALCVASLSSVTTLLILCIAWNPINPRTNAPNNQNITMQEPEEQIALLSEQLSVQNSTIQQLEALIQSEHDLRNENQWKSWQIDEMGQDRKDLQKAIVSLNEILSIAWNPITPRTNASNNQENTMQQSDEQIALLREQLYVQNNTLQQITALIQTEHDLRNENAWKSWHIEEVEHDRKDLQKAIISLNEILKDADESEEESSRIACIISWSMSFISSSIGVIGKGLVWLTVFTVCIVILIYTVPDEDSFEVWFRSWFTKQVWPITRKAPAALGFNPSFPDNTSPNWIANALLKHFRRLLIALGGFVLCQGVINIILQESPRIRKFLIFRIAKVHLPIRELFTALADIQREQTGEESNVERMIGDMPQIKLIFIGVAGVWFLNPVHKLGLIVCEHGLEHLINQQGEVVPPADGQTAEAIEQAPWMNLLY